MELKDLFDPVVKNDILDRIGKLTPQSQCQWVVLWAFTLFQEQF